VLHDRHPQAYSIYPFAHTGIANVHVGCMQVATLALSSIQIYIYTKLDDCVTTQWVTRSKTALGNCWVETYAKASGGGELDSFGAHYRNDSRQRESHKCK
jgi:hypothetical protein